MDDDLRQYLDEKFSRIDQRLARLEGRVTARLEPAETKLSPAELRKRTRAAVLRLIDPQMEI
jgi:hypothetical protein